ncbi:hypothetical protein AB0478_47610 [Streptomyces sp. NPDC051917]|uniref:hypothetical protein n=1 Tax=Streptomyces sp. NPDC051917 TaxID=3154754 RepID=UPI003454C68F
MHLPALHRYAPAFTAVHHTALYGIVPGRVSPAASWRRWGVYDRLLLAALGRAELLAALRADVPGVDGHLAHALLDDPALLGEPAAWWTELAAGPDGVAAVGRLPGGRLGWTCGGPRSQPPVCCRARWPVWAPSRTQPPRRRCGSS